MKDIFLISYIATASVFFTSCDSKHAEKPATQSDTTHIQAPVHPDTIVSSVISAVVLDSSFHEDPARATRQYKGKTITVTGKIKAVLQNKSTKHKGVNWITLYTGSKSTTSQVLCKFSDANLIGELKKGQQVTVKGICIGTVRHNVQIKESEIVQ